MRVLTIFAALAVLLPLSAAHAQDKCGPLRRLDSIQMTREPVSSFDPLLGVDLVPVKVNGVAKNFVLNSSAPFTMLGRPVADELKLPTQSSYITMINLDTKEKTSEHAKVRELAMGRMLGKDEDIPIIEVSDAHDGDIALRQFETDDIDIDFSTDRLNFFSSDHCPGGVIYWKTALVAALPMKMDADWITFPATLDGHEVKAIISTGRMATNLRTDIAQQVFGLTLGGDDTPASEDMLHDPTLKTYSHKFKSLSIGSIVIDDIPTIVVPTGAYKDNDRRELVSDRTKTERNLVIVPELSVGMDVLRQLHIYVAFKEGKIYVSKIPATPTGPDVH